jgi:hypothetical protein
VYGGVRLNGSRVKISLLLKDDHSDITVIAPLYTYLHTYKEADLFIAPFYELLIEYAVLHRVYVADCLFQRR